MVRKKYTHLFFDLDSTLWDFDNNSRDAMYNAFLHFQMHRHCTSFLLFFETYCRINMLLWDEFRKGKLVKKDLVRQRFSLTFNELNIAGYDPLALNDFYLREMPHQKRLMPGTEELLPYLKSKGYLLYIITNGFREVQHQKLKLAGIDKYFSKVFISEDIKATKPSPEIFEYAVKSANARKKNCLMIGDDWHADIEGAIGFGMDAVYINHSHDNLLHRQVLPVSQLLQVSALADLGNYL